MTLLQYSTFLSVAVLALLGILGCAKIAFVLSKKARTKMINKGYDFYILLAGAIAAFSTISVLIYQYIYNLEVCELCWWQRIFMFPIEIVAFYSLWFRQRGTHLTIGTLALIGAGFAAYHYWNHFQNIVLGKEITLPCGQVGLVPSCSEFTFAIWGFFTLPGMALAAFLSITALMFFAHYAKKRLS